MFMSVTCSGMCTHVCMWESVADLRLSVSETVLIRFFETGSLIGRGLLLRLESKNSSCPHLSSGASKSCHLTWLFMCGFWG